jgi:hypothetical protein
MEDALSKVKAQEMQDAMRLSAIEAYRHVHEMLALGCGADELKSYMAAMIKLECSRLPKDVVK